MSLILKRNQRLWTTPSLGKCSVTSNVLPGTNDQEHTAFKPCSIQIKRTLNIHILDLYARNLWRNRQRPNNGAGHCHAPEGNPGPSAPACLLTLPRTSLTNPQTAQAGGCSRKQNALHGVSRLGSICQWWICHFWCWRANANWLLEVFLSGSGWRADCASRFPPCTNEQRAAVLLGCCPSTAPSASPSVLACLLVPPPHSSHWDTGNRLAMAHMDVPSLDYLDYPESTGKDEEETGL